MARAAVLVADDEAPIRATITRLLRLLGVEEILEATNGQEAVDQVKATPDVKLVLMDLKMPVKDGLRALAEMKTFKPELRVVILTGYPFYEQADQAVQQWGAFDFLVKPVDLDYLERIVTVALAQGEGQPAKPAPAAKPP